MSERYSRYEQLKFDRPHPRVLRIRIASPLKLNAMTATLHRECSEIWKDVDADKSVSSVIITGSDKAFSAGGDLAHERRVCDDYELRMQAMKESRNLVFNMIDCSKPIVSAVRGWAVGAGIAVRAARGHFDRREGCEVLRRTREDRHCLGRSRHDSLAAVVWHGARQVLPAALGAVQRRAGGRDGSGISRGRGCRARRQGDRDRRPPGRTRARGSALDQADAQSLAAAGGADFRCLARARIHGHGGARGPRGDRRLPAEACPQLLPDTPI